MPPAWLLLSHLLWTGACYGLDPLSSCPCLTFPTLPWASVLPSRGLHLPCSPLSPTKMVREGERFRRQLRGVLGVTIHCLGSRLTAQSKEEHVPPDARVD